MELYMYICKFVHISVQYTLSTFPTLFFKDLPACLLTFSHQCVTLISFTCRNERFCYWF